MAQFKVGDRVSIYGFHAQDAGIVLKRSIAEMGTDGLLLTDAGEYVHPNQCRRLVKKKRQEIEVLGFDTCDGDFHLIVSPGIRIYKGMKLREVKERK